MTSSQLQLIAHLFDRSAKDINYWWVNHKQTFKEEIGGGYIWSPKRNRDGGRNQTYLNLPKTKTGDFVFSYAGSKIRALGIVVGPCREEARPVEFGERGHQWDVNGWLVPVEWISFEDPLVPRDHIDEIAHLLPSVHSPIRPNGIGNQGVYLASISQDLGKRLLVLSRASAEKALIVASDVRNRILDDKAEEELNQEDLPIVEKHQLIVARRGQGIFRSGLETIEKACRLTGVNDKRFLIASHIKPWRDSDNREKLDKNNGLLLSPHADKLFDNGWISIDKKSKLMCTTAEIENLMQKWGLDLRRNVGVFNKRQLEYLGYHREVVFRG